MNRAALLEESISKTPAKNIGWLDTIPTVLPPILANPTIILLAKVS
jgi:hypothetical protein